MKELANLNVDCLLSGNVINHMGSVSMRRGLNLRYEVRWGNTQPHKCCGASGNQNVGAKEGVACEALEATDLGAGKGGVPLLIEDPDFVARFTDGQWTVIWK